MYRQKYDDGSLFIVIKSLIYFEDAETDPMPNVFNNISWKEIKNFIMASVKKLSL